MSQVMEINPGDGDSSRGGSRYAFDTIVVASPNPLKYHYKSKVLGEIQYASGHGD